MKALLEANKNRILLNYKYKKYYSDLKSELKNIKKKYAEIKQKKKKIDSEFNILYKLIDKNTHYNINKDLKSIKYNDLTYSYNDLEKMLIDLKEKIELEEKNMSNLTQNSFEINKKLNAIPKNASSVRIRNRCLITGRARGLVSYKYFKMSGTKLREHINKGNIPGIYKT